MELFTCVIERCIDALELSRPAEALSPPVTIDLVAPEVAPTNKCC